MHSATDSYKVVYPYDAQLRDELTIKPDDIIYLERTSLSEPDWWRGRLKKSTGSSESIGLFYKDFVVPYQSEKPHKVNRLRTKLGNQVSYMHSDYLVQENPDLAELECIICKTMNLRPCQTDCCGHTICEDCTGVFVTTKQRGATCPVCRVYPFHFRGDSRVKRLISGLTAYCVHYDRGCEWTGSVVKVKEHLTKECNYEPVKCQCLEKIERQNLDDHKKVCPKRQAVCPCCKLPGHLNYQSLVSWHYQMCPGWPRRCPNNCKTQGLTKSTLETHVIHSCPESDLTCEFSEFGCKKIIKRQKMGEHIQSKHVLDLASNYTKMKDENSALRIRNGDLEEAFANLQSAYNSLKKDHENLGSQYACQTADKLDLEGHYTHQMDLKTALEKKYSHQRADREILDGQYALLVIEKSDLEEQLTEETTKRRSLKGKYAALRADKAGLEKSVTVLQERCDRLTAEKVALQDQCDRHLREKRTSEGQISKYAATIVILVVLLIAAVIVL
jgi:TNF receptor-associated factor 4